MKPLLTLLCLFITTDNVFCTCGKPYVFPGISTFGPECRYRCNCLNNEQCNATTGECPTGCLPGWMGPACQYRNMAAAAILTNSEQYPIGDAFPPRYATDGDVLTCSRTGSTGSGPRYLKIDLGSPVYIVGLVIRFPTSDVNTFSGFTVDVGNDSSAIVQCYSNDRTGDLNEVMEINCLQPRVGKLIRIQLAMEQANLSICEISIYGGRIISFNKKTDINSLYTDGKGQPFNGEHAVDGKIHNDITTSVQTTCAASVNSTDLQTRWWSVDLLNSFSIQAFSFFARQDNNDQHSGYYITVFGADSSNSMEVFRDQVSVQNRQTYYKPKSYNLTLPRDGRFVKVSRDNNTVLTICELEIFAECTYGNCGWACNETCMCNNQTAGKHKVLGTCPHGCAVGWYGIDGKCNRVCPVDKWGPTCDQDCGHCASPCSVVNGTCPVSCDSGWKPPNCTQECSKGTYGVNCSEVCGNCQTGTTCNRTTGHCDFGCNPGYKAPYCVDVCDAGFYGQRCSSACGRCNNDTCQHINGTCLNKCEPGFQAPYCNETCSNMFFGMECKSQCGNCINGETCDNVNGSCLNGCAPGWETAPFCNKSCRNGKYGDGCSLTCGFCLNNSVCTKENGTCSSGCQAGYTGPGCLSICDAGFYGQECASLCGRCKDNETCQHNNGTCLNKCEPGFQEPYCAETCSKMSFGVECKNECGNCRNGATCGNVNGYCPKGCAPGWEATSFCNQSCSNGTYGDGCSQTCGFCFNSSICTKENGSCPDGCQAGYTGPGCLTRIEEKTGYSRGADAGPIIGGVIGGVVVLTVVVAMCIVFQKRRSSGAGVKYIHEIEPSGTINNPRGSNDDEGVVRMSEEHENHDDEYYNTHDQCYEEPDINCIDVVNLRAQCRKVKNDPKYIYAEFQTIPYGPLKDMSDASRPEYVKKNRYRDLYPYNENRVQLPEVLGDPISTYINASYINGFDRPKKYIAAQGALKSTIDDIWRMVWSENIDVIVMLTDCIEEGKLKCVKYWPAERSELYGQISVDLTSEEEYTDFKIRRFQVTKDDEKGKKTVVQYHYTAWPDKDVPDTALSIVQFWRKVREHAVAGNNTCQLSPWLVHCSAGIGRTGTFIATDILYDQGKNEGRVNVKTCVLNLRNQRLKMVQTKEQYILLHEILAEILDPIGTVFSNEEFSAIYPTLVSNSATNKQRLYVEYQEIHKFTEEMAEARQEGGIYFNAFSEQKRDGEKLENIRKSRDSSTIPEDRDRPRLSTPVDGCNDFINAVYISTYRYKDRIILTQYPLNETIVDFIRMIWQYDLTEIVLLENPALEDGMYWSKPKGYQVVGPFKVETLREKSEESYILRTLRVSMHGNKQRKEVRVYHYQTWANGKSIPDNTSSVLQLISDVENSRGNGVRAPVVVQCLDGFKRSGVICTIYSIMERMKLDRQVAVAETVRLARVRRRQIIDNFEQYRFCHDVINEYLNNCNVYANVT